MASLAAMKEQAGSKPSNPIALHKGFLEKRIPQLSIGVPAHMNVQRLVRGAIVAMMQNPQLATCSEESVYQSLSVAANLALPIGGGMGYLVPYKGQCTFVPGWQGLVDLVSRSGRGTVWTGAVFDGDHFDFALGDSPFVKHQPMGEDDPQKITHVYAIGRVKGSDWPIIEVWSMSRVMKHLAKYNKVGSRHYAYANLEMYARKVVLLQVLKYMPKSQDLQNAIEANDAAEAGRGVTIDGDFMYVNPESASVPAGQDFTHQGGDFGDEQHLHQAASDGNETHQQQAEAAVTAGPPELDFGKTMASIKRASDTDVLDAAADLIGEFKDEGERAQLRAAYTARKAELEGGAPAPRQRRAMGVE